MQKDVAFDTKLNKVEEKSDLVENRLQEFKRKLEDAGVFETGRFRSPSSNGRWSRGPGSHCRYHVPEFLFVRGFTSFYSSDDALEDHEVITWIEHLSELLDHEFQNKTQWSSFQYLKRQSLLRED